MAAGGASQCIEGVGMNEGTLALGVIIATIAAMIYLSWNRELLFPSTDQPSRSERKPLQQRQPKARIVRRPAATRPEIAPQRPAAVSAPVSSIATPNDDAEMVALRTIAKLVAADLVTETKALERVFNVKAGNGKDYQRVQAKLKEAQAELKREGVAQ